MAGLSDRSRKEGLQRVTKNFRHDGYIHYLECRVVLQVYRYVKLYYAAFTVWKGRFKAIRNILNLSSLVSLVRKTNWYSSFGEQYENMYFKTFKVLLTFNLEVSYLGFYPKRVILNTEKTLCSEMFNAILFIVVKTWKQSKYLWIKFLQWNIMQTLKWCLIRNYSKKEDEYLTWGERQKTKRQLIEWS